MSWDLKKGRNKFLARNQFDSERSFWWHLFRAMARTSPDARDALGDYEAKHQEVLDWSPTSSNCPALAEAVADVRDALPDEWKALARNIFVGIVMSPEVSAKAWNHHDAGVVEISLQYLWALEAYASAFDEFAYALRERLNSDGEAPTAVSGAGYGDVRSIWMRLDEAADSWRATDAIHPGSPDLVRLAPGRSRWDFEKYQSSAQEFIICHEIAHHVLAHTASSASRRQREARALIAPIFEQLAPDLLAALSKDSVQEIHADLVALAIMFGHFARPMTREKAYRGLTGAVMALVTATHVDDHLLAYDPSDTHPPLVLRLWFIFAATDRWMSEVPPGDLGDHPMDYALQLRTFVESLLTHWLELNYPVVAEANAQRTNEEYLDALEARYLEGRILLSQRFLQPPEPT